MCVKGPSIKPNWDLLYEVASGQDGYFTTQQAAEAGYSPQLLLKHLHAGRIERTQRKVYRLVHFPAGEHEELIATWLWSDRIGVFSHGTALMLHGLSDALPAQTHLTLPSKRRLRVPPGVELHYAEVAKEDRAWVASVPVTSPVRTLNDCAHGNLSPELLRQASRQALRRGLVAKSELGDVEAVLRLFGGIGE